MTDEYVIDVHNIFKSFAGKPAVIDVSLKVKRGEIFGFLGPNGSGKTTTIRMLCGLMTPDSGAGHCLGYDILNDSRKIKRLVGYVPQYFSLYKDLSVKENLEFVARVYEEPNFKLKVKNLMVELGLDHYQNILAGRLSGGWKQRVSLAAALIHDPQLLLLDEPTAGVDPKARREFWNQVSHLTTQGITSLVTTHYMDEAERCNRMAYIVYGRMMAEGTAQQIIDKVNLTTWAASGNGLAQLRLKIQDLPGVELVTPLGNELRVCGTDPELLEKMIASHSDFQWNKVPTNLEEAFVFLVGERATS